MSDNGTPLAPLPCRNGVYWFRRGKERGQTTPSVNSKTPILSLQGETKGAGQEEADSKGALPGQLGELSLP